MKFLVTNKKAVEIEKQIIKNRQRPMNSMSAMRRINERGAYLESIMNQELANLPPIAKQRDASGRLIPFRRFFYRS